jgi:hypothetical protein
MSRNSLALLSSLVVLSMACRHEAAEGGPAAGSSSASVSPSSAPSSAPSASAAATTPPDDDEATALATRYVDALKAAKWDDACAMHDEAMTKAFPRDKAQATWQALTSKLGALKSTALHKIERKAPYARTVLKATFEKDVVGLAVVIDESRKVAGFFVVPIDQKPAVAWTPPEYAKPDGFTEEEISIGDGALALPGTLTLPKKSKSAQGPFRAIVLVHGSGPNDRDESIAGSKVFKDLAWGLASRGFAVLRYEKVTKAHPKEWLAKVGDGVTLDNETTNDAVAAAAWLRKRPEIDGKRVYVLGHSQGGLAAPRIAKADPALAGIVIFAGPTRAFEDLALSQFEYIATIPGANGEGAKEALPKVRESVKLVKSKELSAKTPKDSLPLGIPAAFWLDLRGYHPEALAAQLKRPILVLQGESDYQVTMEDFEGWKKTLGGKPFATLQSFPGLLHTFADCGCKKGKPEDYQKPAHVDAKVVDAIATWMAK